MPTPPPTNTPDLFSRHSEELLLAETAATLVHCAGAAPAGLQDAAGRALRGACSSTAAKLGAAAAAVGRLGHYDLAAGVAALEAEARARARGGGDVAAAARASGSAPAALHSLLGALQRARSLLSAGARELAAEPQAAKAVQALLQGHASGRDLGTLLASAAVAVGQLLMVWAHAAVAEELADAIEDADGDEEQEEEGGEEAAAGARRGRRAAAAAAAAGPSAAAVSELASRRAAFVRALEAVLEAPPPPAPAASDDDEDDAGGVEGAAAVARAQAEALRDQAFCALADLALLTNCGALAGVDGLPMPVGRALVARLWGHLERLLADDADDEMGGGAGGGDGDDDGWDGVCAVSVCLLLLLRPPGT